MCIEKYGFRPDMLAQNTAGIPARITAVHREYFEFVCDNGNSIAHLKASEYHAGDEPFPTTGDFVLLDWQQNGQSRIIKTLPRRTYFSRRDPSMSGYGEQLVAANFDYVFIMQALDRDFNIRRLERYLTLSWQSGAVPIIVMTKADLHQDNSAQISAVKSLAIGVDVFTVSSITGEGVKALAEYLKPGRTIVFLGSSGVGKSTLVNSLAGKEIMKTKEVREKDSRGRHATTHRQLILLESGVMIIDTPGMRELGMWDVTQGLGQSFADLEQYFGQCRFRDCTHQNEPGCAVKAAIREGKLSPQRWESYLQLGMEASYADDKIGYLKSKDKRFKDIAVMIKSWKKGGTEQPLISDGFICASCGAPVSPTIAGGEHRNHCPHCLASVHADNRPGDRASLCKGIMDAISVWVKENGEWALIHRCRTCGVLSSNRIAADDRPEALMALAKKPLQSPAFPEK